MSDFYDGLYILKQIEFTNNIFNVTSQCHFNVGATQVNLTPGFYDHTQFAAELQTQVITQDAGATVTYDAITDKFTINNSVPGGLVLSEVLAEMVGMKRGQQATGNITSTKRTNLAPYSLIDVSISDTRDEDIITVTTDAKYNDRVIWKTDKVIYFFTAYSPRLIAESRGLQIELLNASFIVEKVN